MSYFPLSTDLTFSPSFSLSTIGTPGTFGSNNLSAIITTDSKGRITNASTAPINADSGTFVPTANRVCKWDLNANMRANNLLEGYETLITSNGIKSLTASSGKLQYFTGSSNHTLVLPNTSTLDLGEEFKITNSSTGIVNVSNSSNIMISALDTGTKTTLTNINTGIGWKGGNIESYPSPYVYGLAFDGTYIWTANTGLNTIYKITNIGVIAGTYSSPSPTLMTFDGSNIWVTNQNDDYVTKIDAQSGTFIGTYATGTTPKAIAFDGNHIWVSNEGSSNISKILASTGTLINTISVPSPVYSLSFDGNYMWASYGSFLIKLNITTNQVLSTFSVLANNYGICFEGEYIWIASASGNIGKYSAYDGTSLGSVSLTVANDVCFDGTYIWAGGNSEVLKILPSNLTIINRYSFSASVLRFDGANIWASELMPLASGAYLKQIIQKTVATTLSTPMLTTFTNVSLDTNSNTKINNVIQGYANRVTTTGQTYVLSIISGHTQTFTGNSNCTVMLPTPPSLGFSYDLINASSGSLTIRSSGNNLVTTIESAISPTLARSVSLISTLAGGTTATSWIASI